MSARKKPVVSPDDDPPLTGAERRAIEALGWRRTGGGRRPDGITFLSYHAPTAAPDAPPEQRTRAEWRAVLAGAESPQAAPDPLAARRAALEAQGYYFEERPPARKNGSAYWVAKQHDGLGSLLGDTLPELLTQVEELIACLARAAQLPRRAEESRAVADELFLRLKASSSTASIPGGKIKAPVAWDDGLWVSTGDGSGGEDVCRVVLAEAWPHPSFTYSEKIHAGLTGAEFYTGMRVTGRGKSYVLTHERRVVVRQSADDKALAVVEPVVEGHLVMSREEAEEAEAAIIATAENLRQQIDDFDQRRGWMALGHASFRAWAQERFPDTSLPTIYRQRDAALVDRDLGVAIGTTPESHARELKHVPSEERAATVQRADELAQEAGRPRQASDVKRAAQERSGGSERVANGNTAQGLPAPLAAVAEALRRGNEQAAYEAARRVSRDHYDQAMAAVDARVEGKPLEEALALLAPPTPAAAFDAMIADARADLTARAAAVGYTLTWNDGGAARLVQTATGAPMGGARDMGEALERVEALERQAAQAAPARPLEAAEGKAEERNYIQLEQILAGLLDRITPAERYALAVVGLPDEDLDLGALDDPGEALWEHWTITAHARPGYVAAALGREVPA
jgi:hypothetical protein